jgi:hypothetical protein
MSTTQQWILLGAIVTSLAALYAWLFLRRP